MFCVSIYWKSQTWFRDHKFCPMLCWHYSWGIKVELTIDPVLDLRLLFKLNWKFQLLYFYTRLMIGCVSTNITLFRCYVFCQNIYQIVVYHQLVSFFEINQIFIENHFSFRKKSLTYMAIAVLVDKLMMKLENGGYVNDVFWFLKGFWHIRSR